MNKVDQFLELVHPQHTPLSLSTFSHKPSCFNEPKKCGIHMILILPPGI